MRAGFWMLVLALCPGVARGQVADIAQAVRTADWMTAQAAAAGYADPIAAKLVTFYRLQHAGDAGAAEIAGFMAANPDWPAQATLLKRRDDALAGEAEDMAVLPLCMARPAVPGPRSGAALARCAAAQSAAGQRDEALASARAAWVAGFADADSEAQFVQRWGGVLTAADQAERFRALLAANAPGAAAQLGRLAAADQPVARARLALRGGDAAGVGVAAALVAAVPAADRGAPELVLDEVRAARKAGRDEDALALWRSAGFAAELRAGAGAAAAFWVERAQLARRRLQAGDAQGAYLLADDGMQTEPEPQTEAAFLAGFIALRRLDRPALAAAHFQVLAGSTAAISQARAHYWLGRAAAAGRDEATARREYGAAAAWPTTYYGQLAALALGDGAAGLAARIAALRDPGWSAREALDFAGRELTRAAAMLVSWGDPGRARAFLQQVQALAADPATRSMDAHFALGLGLPDQAVAAARRAGRDGTVLAEAGWPMAVEPPDGPPDGPVPAAVALGVIRQESSFDAGAVSPSGARGLMQLMPATARQVGEQIGGGVQVAALTADPAANMRLGTAYLRQLTDAFAGSLPLAIAAYNAGPNRVRQWLGELGDPRTGGGGAALIDWIELIPFSETRNYVQRVIENIAVYGAKRRAPLPYPVGS